MICIVLLFNVKYYHYYIYIYIYTAAIMYEKNNNEFRHKNDVLHLHDSIQFKIICTVLFTIQSLQSSFTGNYVSTIDLYIVEILNI